MKEVTFFVKESEEGGFTAKCLEYAIFTEGESVDDLRRNIREAIECYFGDEIKPKFAHLHFVKDEVISLI
jgi:predicted RNase H-like HicB family nuclease